MASVSQRDLQRLQESLTQLYAQHDLDSFPQAVVSVLPQLVDSEKTAYNELNAKQGRMVSILTPNDLPLSELTEPFEAYMHQHPVISHYDLTGDAKTYKISDFLSDNEFRRTDLYNALYRRIDVEYQMALTLPGPKSLVVGAVVNRKKRDFSERERLLLNLLRPHLFQAYCNAAVISKLKDQLADSRLAMESQGVSTASVTDKGRVIDAAPNAERWMTQFFGPRRGNDHLPDPLLGWFLRQTRDAGDRSCPSRTPLRVQRDQAALSIRCVGGGGNDGAGSGASRRRFLLVIERRETRVDPTCLRQLGLTARQAEVLAWAAEGKTNSEIGIILSISARTVQKHLEHVFQKLGVETRTAAMLQALQATGRTV